MNSKHSRGSKSAEEIEWNQIPNEYNNKNGNDFSSLTDSTGNSSEKSCSQQVSHENSSLKLIIPRIRTRSLSRDQPSSDDCFINDVTPLPSPQLSNDEAQGIFRIYNGQSPPMSAVSRAPSVRGRPPSFSNKTSMLQFELNKEEHTSSQDPGYQLNLLGERLSQLGQQNQDSVISTDRRTISEYVPAPLTKPESRPSTNKVPSVVEPCTDADFLLTAKKTPYSSDSVANSQNVEISEKSSSLPITSEPESSNRQDNKSFLRPKYGRVCSSGSQLMTLNNMKRESPKLVGMPDSTDQSVNSHQLTKSIERLDPKVYEAYDTNRRKSIWTGKKLIGRGAFSRVILGSPCERHIKAELREQAHSFQVAIKIIELGVPESLERERIEASLRREVDILKSISHPNLIRIFGFNMDKNKAIMILPYCPGGDLFDLASTVRSSLTPHLVRRIFGEIAQAVQYLHSRHIVHRDIKLENVLLNIVVEKLINMSDNEIDDYYHPIITVTDLGLSRRIDPENPILTTRCGSEDYVPPEILMGQPYDGRQSDSWALGVLLYAIMEGRLPFDPPKYVSSNRRRGRTAHRIARVEWSWLLFRDNEQYNQEWEGGKRIVEGCLQKRDNRISVIDIVHHSWIKHMVPTLVNDHCQDISAIFN